MELVSVVMAFVRDNAFLLNKYTNTEKYFYEVGFTKSTVSNFLKPRAMKEDIFEYINTRATMLQL